MTIAQIDVVNAIAGNGEALGITVDTLGSTADYKAYSGTLTTNAIIDVYTDLGREASGGYIANDDAVADKIEILFSRDGSAWGGGIFVHAGEKFEFYNWIIFRKIQLVHSADAPYRLVVR